MTRLLETAPLGERLRQGALIVLAGRPNAGKSSLFNALLGTDRALVTEIPGTTRDTIEAASEIDGWPIRLADTAGLREASDRVERLGVEVSRKYLEAADLVLFCVEGSRELDPEELAVVRRRPAIVIRTKTDLHPAPDISASGAVSVSVVTGQGLEALKARMAELLFAGGETGVSLEPMLSRERHRHALARARSEIDDALLNLDEGEPVLAAHHVRQSILALEELIGVVDVDEVLGAVFERFCVGK
jgi:tRNA modification GTPase